MKKIIRKIRRAYKRGAFTIIELIVVIAIISILSSVVLANVVGYINKAKDAKIKTDLSGVLQEASAYQSENNTYSGYAISAGVTSPCGDQSYTVSSTDDSFVAYHQLCGSDKYWCADSTGTMSQLDNPPDAGVYTCISGSGGGGGGGNSEEDNIRSLMSQLPAAANEYSASFGSLDNMCNFDTNIGTSYRNLADQLNPQGSARMYGCKDPAYSWGWSGYTTGWVVCIDFYDGLFSNGHYCADYAGYNNTTEQDCMTIFNNYQNCTGN